MLKRKLNPYKKPKPPLITNRVLDRMFKLVDATFYGGRLRHIVVGVRFASDKFMHGNMGRTRPFWAENGQTQFMIYINNTYRHNRRITYTTLLHETKHCEKYWIVCDSQIFNREMVELAARGAMHGSW